MRTKSAVGSVVKRVMEATGFYHEGKPTPGLLDAARLLKNKKLFDRHFKYQAVIHPDNLGAFAVFELAGSPCIYFKYLEGQTPFPVELARIHRVAWNHGLAPLLWVITDTEILIYSCFSKPTRQDEHDPARHLIESFKTTPADLKRLSAFAGRVAVETGTLWRHEKMKKIDRDQRVDRSLLNDLSQIREKLAATGLAPALAAGLLGRSILVAWLQDRGILDKRFFRDRYGADKFSQVLKNPDDAYDLFEWLETKFHGNIFPLTIESPKPVRERDHVKPEHLQIVRKLFEHQRIKRGVKQPWPYDFNVIPVEFISSIYEMFITGSTLANLGSVRSTHYTPLNLVDLVLTNVFDLVKREGNILDLSCGSGVFLVEALRRLLARQIALGKKWTRTLVRDTLYKFIYGLDVNPAALQVTAFCLYLTTLELDPDLRQGDPLEFEPLIGKNLILADAFDVFDPFNIAEPFRSRNFAAVIGNPPWTRSKDKGLAWDYCRQHRYPLARSDTPDQAFLWRIARFAGDKTAIGLILHASPYFSHAKPALKAKQAILTLFTPRVLIDLSDLRQEVLFPKSTAPGLVFVALGRRPEEDDRCKIARPERVNAFKRHGIVELADEQFRQVLVLELASDPDLFKIASCGQLADFQLVRKLREAFPSLERFCNHLRCRKGLNRGQGFQKTGGTKDVPELYGLPWLESGKMPRFKIDAEKLPKLPAMNFLSPRNPGIYWGPLLITVRGIAQDGFKAAVCDQNVVYTEEYYGFSFTASKPIYAHYLNGILNSSLASYYLFLTASVWGVERDKIEPNDLVNLPVPPVEPARKALVDAVLSAEGAIVDAEDKSGADREELLRRLDDAVFDLYGLSDLERLRVRDTVEFTIDVRVHREKSLALRPPRPSDLTDYAEKMVQLLSTDEKAIQAQIFEVPSSPLQVVKFTRGSGGRTGVKTLAHKDIEQLLGNIAEEFPPRLQGRLYPRNFFWVSSGSDWYVAKPAQRRWWTTLAALQDAEILAGI